MKPNIERKRLTRFCKLMNRVIYGNPKDLPDGMRQAIMNSPWDSSPIAGLRMAANDIVEMTQDLHGEELRQLDLVLEKAGAVTLSQMRDRGYRLVLKLLSRKTLSKEEDIYLLKAVVENQDERFSESDLRKAEEILERSADAT